MNRVLAWFRRVLSFGYAKHIDPPAFACHSRFEAEWAARNFATQREGHQMWEVLPTEACSRCFLRLLPSLFPKSYRLRKYDPALLPFTGRSGRQSFRWRIGSFPRTGSATSRAATPTSGRSPGSASFPATSLAKWSAFGHFPQVYEYNSKSNPACVDGWWRRARGARLRRQRQRRGNDGGGDCGPRRRHLVGLVEARQA